MRIGRAVCCLLVLLLPMGFVFSNNSISNASLTIEAFKEIPTPEGVFEVNVSYLDGSGSKSTISGIGSRFDVTKRKLSSLTKVFSIAIRSNYGNTVEISFRFGPFVNQMNNSKVVPASYIVSADSQDWSDWNLYWDDYGNYAYYRFKPVFTPNITSSTSGQLVTVTNEEKTVSVVYSVDGQRYVSSSVSYDPGDGVISQLGENVMESTIYGSLMIADSDYDGMEPNVDYVSTVVISMEVR